MKYKHKKWDYCITIRKNILNRSPEILRLLKDKMYQSAICIAHKINYSLLSKYYRLYRCGKNRCCYCGVKIKLINPNKEII